MEKIHTFVAMRSFAKSYWLIASFLILGSVLLLGVRLHAESYNFGIYHDDEYHTVHEGLNLLVTGHVDNFRAQESTRWLVRAFYPYALVYMNTHMGGNVYIDGWSYPGHNYVVKNFIYSTSSPSVLSLDPNLRDLFHALRQQYIFFVFVCLISLLLFFFRKKYYLVAFGGVLLLGFNLDFLAEQKIFYIEPGMIASIALLMLTYCWALYRGQISSKTVILFGFLAACMVSTKFSAALFILLPIVLFFYLLHHRDALRQSATYVVSLVVFYILISFPAFVSLQSFNTFLHDLFSNFWQYSAGSDPGITVASGVSHLGLIVTQLEGLLGYALYVLPICILFALYYSTAKERMVLLPLIVLTSTSIYSLSAQNVYLIRNAIPFYLPVVIVSLLSVEIVIRALASAYSQRLIYGGIVALSLLWCIGVVAHAGGVALFSSEILPDFKNGYMGELRATQEQSKPGDVWYAVGFPEHFFAGETFEKRIVVKDNVPLVLNSQKYPDLVSQFNSLSPGSVVLVNNIENNKHITHYILPKYFNENVQFGSYYVFFNAR